MTFLPGHGPRSYIVSTGLQAKQEAGDLMQLVLSDDDRKGVCVFSGGSYIYIYYCLLLICSRSLMVGSIGNFRCSAETPQRIHY